VLGAAVLLARGGGSGTCDSAPDCCAPGAAADEARDDLGGGVHTAGPGDTGVSDDGHGVVGGNLVRGGTV